MSMLALMSQMPDLWQRILTEHVADQWGQCRACTFGPRDRVSWPCFTFTLAQQARGIATGELPAPAAAPSPAGPSSAAPSSAAQLLDTPAPQNFVGGVPPQGPAAPPPGAVGPAPSFGSSQPGGPPPMSGAQPAGAPQPSGAPYSTAGPPPFGAPPVPASTPTVEAPQGFGDPHAANGFAAETPAPRMPAPESVPPPPARTPAMAGDAAAGGDFRRWLPGEPATQSDGGNAPVGPADDYWAESDRWHGHDADYGDPRPVSAPQRDPEDYSWRRDDTEWGGPSAVPGGEAGRPVPAGPGWTPPEGPFHESWSRNTWHRQAW